MPNGNSKYFFIPVLLGDVFILMFSFGIAYYFFADSNIPNFQYVLNYILATLLWIVGVLLRKIYDIPRFLKIEIILMENVKTLVIFFIICSTLLYFFWDFDRQRLYYLAVFVVFSILQLTWHLCVLLKIKMMRIKGLNYRSVLLVGYNKNMEAMMRKIESSPDAGYQIAGLLTNAEPNELMKHLYRGKLDEVSSFCKKNQVHHLIVSLPHKYSDYINELLHFGDNNLIRVKIIPEFSEYLSQSFYIDYIDLIPVLRFRDEPLESLSNKLIKRSFDLIFSSLVIVGIMSWLYPILAIVIKMTSPGPVLFVQERSGKRGKVFNCFKFRTMKVNNQSDFIQASKNDERITSVGCFLRKTSLDEFPQFFNVFLGNMSVAGPRPHMLKHTEDYSILVNKFMVRHFAKPGITGWAQVKGFRGETKEVEDMRKRAEADIWYLENWSLLLDIKIIFLTIWNIITRKDQNAF